MTLAIVIACLVVYSCIGDYFWRRWAWEFAQDGFNSRGEAVMFGFMQAIFWPIVLACKIVISSDGFLLPPPEIRRREKEQAMQRRIRDLERELEIGKDSVHS